MILRAVVLALTLANLLVYGWTEGWFDGVFGLSSAGDREPARVLAQVEAWAAELGPRWTPAPGLRAVAASGGLLRQMTGR